MTTYNKIEQALSAAKGLQADLETFSLDTDDQEAQQMYSQLAKNLGSSVQALQSRLNFMGGEEPQYVQQSMGMKQQQQQQGKQQ
ncbi:MAG TPA: DUF1657 domain-containing protein [Oscillospiraceae bacterium]|nr:DUF1657 domain-containing protein [Oscillospiraceae bacterium]